MAKHEIKTLQGRIWWVSFLHAFLNSMCDKLHNQWVLKKIPVNFYVLLVCGLPNNGIQALTLEVGIGL